MTARKKGWLIRNRKRNAVRPPPPRRRERDPLAHCPMLAWMNAHFEWMMVTGYTKDTVRARRAAIRRFIAWCDERGLNQPADITKQVLERYQRHLFYYRKPNGKPLTLGTQKSCLAPLKLWFSWLARQNHILYNPASEIDMPRQGWQLPRVILSIAEVESILAEAKGDCPASLRDRALLELLYSAALRRMEAAGVAVYDLDLSRRMLMVRQGKGRKDRVVPVGARALAWLEKYMMEGRPHLLVYDHPALFVTDYGEPASPELITIRVRKHMKLAGLNKPGAAHLLRHACATHMLEGGADIRFIQAILGHSKLDTTAVYTHVSIEKLKAVHEATHPARLHRPGEAAAVPSPDDRAALQNVLDSDTDPES